MGNNVSTQHTAEIESAADLLQNLRRDPPNLRGDEMVLLQDIRGGPLASDIQFILRIWVKYVTGRGAQPRLKEMNYFKLNITMNPSIENVARKLIVHITIWNNEKKKILDVVRLRGLKKRGFLSSFSPQYFICYNPERKGRASVVSHSCVMSTTLKKKKLNNLLKYEVWAENVFMKDDNTRAIPLAKDANSFNLDPYVNDSTHLVICVIVHNVLLEKTLQVLVVKDDTCGTLHNSHLFCKDMRTEETWQAIFKSSMKINELEGCPKGIQEGLELVNHFISHLTFRNNH